MYNILYNNLLKLPLIFMSECGILVTEKRLLPCAIKHSYYKSNTFKKGFGLCKGIADLPPAPYFTAQSTDEGSVKLTGCLTRPAIICGFIGYATARRQLHEK